MKRILLSLAMIAMVSTVAVGATKAYYADTETVLNNTFASGTLDLRLLPGWLSTTEPISAVNWLLEIHSVNLLLCKMQAL